MSQLVTKRLLKEALDLYSLAKVAAEIRNLPSPRSGVERNAKGAPDPTASTALDPRRQEVADALDEAEREAERLAAEISCLRERLESAVKNWGG